MNTRGVRGATTVQRDDKREILAATKELLAEMVKANQIEIEAISAIIFTVTDDLKATFPAEAARDLGWQDTPLLCAREIAVPKSLGQCIRVLMTVNSDKTAQEIKHIYLKEAVNLRK